MEKYDIEDPRYYEARQAELDELAAEARRPRSRGERLDDLYRRHNLAAPHAHRQDEAHSIQAQIDVIVAEITAERDAEWTRETTIARRAAWNAIARTIGTWSALRAQEKLQGWYVDSLKAAVKRQAL